MRMPVRVIRHRGPVWRFEGKTFVNDELCAEAEYSAMITDRSTDSSAPASSAAILFLSSSRTESTMIGTCERSRTKRHSSIPVMSGMERSVMCGLVICDHMPNPWGWMVAPGVRLLSSASMYESWGFVPFSGLRTRMGSRAVR